MQFRWPIAQPPDSIPAGYKFGANRATTTPPHPHGGLDMGTYQTVAYAAAAGTVKFAAAYAQLGGPAMVYITHDDGFETRYMHLDPVTLQVRKGDWVEAGQELANVALINNSVAQSHLHFELLENGVRRDPLAYLGGTGSTGLGWIFWAVGGALLAARLLKG